MIPIEKIIIERSCDDLILDNIYLVKVLGLVVYRRVYHNNVEHHATRTSGFDVLPDERKVVEDLEEEEE